MQKYEEKCSSKGDFYFLQLVLIKKQGLYGPCFDKVKW